MECLSLAKRSLGEIGKLHEDPGRPRSLNLRNSICLNGVKNEIGLDLESKLKTFSVERFDRRMAISRFSSRADPIEREPEIVTTRDDPP